MDTDKFLGRIRALVLHLPKHLGLPLPIGDKIALFVIIVAH